MPGYGRPQESFKTAREGWTGEEPATEEPAESLLIAEEPIQEPAPAQPTSAVEAPQDTPQEGNQDSPRQHAAEAEQGLSDWPHVTLPGEQAASTLLCVSELGSRQHDTLQPASPVCETKRSPNSLGHAWFLQWSLWSDCLPTAGVCLAGIPVTDCSP